jgi:hypothetical protein
MPSFSSKSSEARGQLGFDLREDAWAGRLEREIAIMLAPAFGRPYDKALCRALARRMADLAARRAREALLPGRLELKERICAGCEAPIVAETAIVFCGACGAECRTSRPGGASGREGG